MDLQFWSMDEQVQITSSLCIVELINLYTGSQIKLPVIKGSTEAVTSQRTCAQGLFIRIISYL